jgi:hypothetical protein
MILLMACTEGGFSLHSNAMRKVLLPIALFFAAILLLVGAAYWYDQKYGSEGPFRNQHGH